MQQENQPLTILIVDDLDINQKIIAITLQKLGYHPDVAGSGPEAIKKYDTKKYDLIIMDIHMPDMDGVEVATRIRGLENTGPHKSFIVALTADDTADLHKRCKAAGMNHFATKPIKREQLLLLIEAARGAKYGNPDTFTLAGKCGGRICAENTGFVLTDV